MSHKNNIQLPFKRQQQTNSTNNKMNNHQILQYHKNNINQQNNIISLLKAFYFLLNCHFAQQSKKVAFLKLKIYTQILTKNQHLQTKGQSITIQIEDNNFFSIPTLIGQQLLNRIQQRIQLQNQQQASFIRLIQEVSKEQETNQRQAIININNIFNNLKRHQLYQALKKIQTINLSQKYFSIALNLIFLRIKILLQIQYKYSFNRLNYAKKQFKNQNLSLQTKGKLLLKLDKFSKRLLNNSFQRWRFQFSSKGTSILQAVANNLVLYTNTNKISAFYRLFYSIKKNRMRIPSKFKQALMITGIILNNLIYQVKKDSLQKLKIMFCQQSLAIMTKKLLQSQKQILLKKCKHTFNSFIAIEKVLKKNSDILFFSKVQKNKIVWAFLKMISNLKDNQRQVIKIWRNFTSQSILNQNFTYNSQYCIVDKNIKSQQHFKIQRKFQNTLTGSFFSQKQQQFRQFV